MRNTRLLLLFNFCVDFRPYAAVAILYFSRVSGSFTRGTAVLSVIMLTAAIFDVPTGAISDRIGRKPTIVAGACAIGGAVVCYALGSAYALLLIGAAFEGLGRALYSGNNQALLYDTLAENGLQRSYAAYSGRMTATFQLAAGIAAVVGSAVAAVSFTLMMWLSVIPQLACILIASFFIEPHRRIDSGSYQRGSIRAALSVVRRNRQLQRLIVAGAVTYGVGESGFQFMPAFTATVWPLWAIGAARTLSNGLATVSFWLSGRIIRRFGASGTLIFGQLITWCVTWAALIKPTGASPALLSSESALYGCVSVSQDTLQQQEFTDTERATIASLGSLARNITFAGYSLLVGIVADHVGPGRALLMGQIVILPAFVLLWFVHRRRAPMPVHVP